MNAALAALALTVILVPEADWWYVTMSGEVGELHVHYADRASIQREGDRVTVAEAREGETASAMGIRSSRTAVEYDCRARTGRIHHGVFFASDGSVVRREQGDGIFLPAEPESVLESMLRFACGDDEGIEQLGDLPIREQAELLFQDYRAHRALHPAERE